MFVSALVFSIFNFSNCYADEFEDDLSSNTNGEPTWDRKMLKKMGHEAGYIITGSYSKMTKKFKIHASMIDILTREVIASSNSSVRLDEMDPILVDDYPSKSALPAPLPGEVKYSNLISQALSKKYVGQTITFRATYMSLWQEVGSYRMAGINTDNLVFLNHCDINDSRSENTDSSNSGLSMDALIRQFGFPPFALSISADNVGMIANLKKGDFIGVTGKVEQPLSQCH